MNVLTSRYRTLLNQQSTIGYERFRRVSISGNAKNIRSLVVLRKFGSYAKYNNEINQ